MLVYRVETDTGLGPWCDANGDWANGAGTNWCEAAAGIHWHAHNWLKTDRAKGWRFGFYSLEQMFHYMYDHDVQSEHESYVHYHLRTLFGYMDDQHLQVSVYDVWYSNSNSIGDGTQCIFNPAEAKLLKRLHPRSDFINNAINEHGRRITALLAA